MAPSGTIKTVSAKSRSLWLTWSGVVNGGRWLAGLARLKQLSPSRAEFAIVPPDQGRLEHLLSQFTPTSIWRAYEAVLEGRTGSLEALVDLPRALGFAPGCPAPVESQTWLAVLERNVSNPYLLQYMVLLLKLISSSIDPKLASSHHTLIVGNLRTSSTIAIRDAVPLPPRLPRAINIENISENGSISWMIFRGRSRGERPWTRASNWIHVSGVASS